MDTQQHKHNKKTFVLSAKAVKEFQNAYLLEFGIHVTPQQAQTQGLRFLQFMKHVLKPIPEHTKVDNYGKK